MVALANFLLAVMVISGFFVICIPTLGLAHNWEYLSKPENIKMLNQGLIFWGISGFLTGIPALIFWRLPHLLKLTGNGTDWIPYMLLITMIPTLVYGIYSWLTQS